LLRIAQEYEALGGLRDSEDVGERHLPASSTKRTSSVSEPSGDGHDGGTIVVKCRQRRGIVGGYRDAGWIFFRRFTGRAYLLRL
jgi:hypothetical protein